MLYMDLDSQLTNVILEYAEYCHFLIRRILMTTVTLHFYANKNNRISQVGKDPQ